MMDDERQAAISVQVDYLANRLEVKVNKMFFFQKIATLQTFVLRFDNIWLNAAQKPKVLLTF